MPKKSTSSTSPKKDDLQVFVYPTVGEGTSIRAKNREEADKKAQEILKNLTPTEEATE